MRIPVLDEVVGPTNIDLENIPPSVRILRRKRLRRRHKSATTKYARACVGRAKRTFIHGAKSASVGDENVQTAEAGHGGGDHLFCLFHVAHVGGEGEDLRGGVLAKDRVFARVEGSLRASHQGERGTGARVLQRDLGTDPARCASDQHNFVCEALRVIVDVGIDRWIDTWMVSALGHEENRDKTEFATHS